MLEKEIADRGLPTKNNFGLNLAVNLMENPNPESKQDGRVARTHATRRAILTAARELILSGENEPRAIQIASAAKVTPRTLFRHFPDMGSVYCCLVEEAESGASKVMEEPFPESSESNESARWRELARVVCDRRVRVYESLLPLYASKIWEQYRGDSARKARHSRGISRRRQRLKHVLPQRVRDDAILFEAIDAVLSIDYWLSLRRDQRLSVRRASQVVRQAVEKLSS